MSRKAKNVKKTIRKKTPIKPGQGSEGIPFLPVSWQAFIARRIMDMIGLSLLVLGLALMAIFASYNSADPSFNTTISDHIAIQNWLGAPGAHIADLFMQTLGLGSIVFAIVPTIWGLRMLRRSPISPVIARMITMILTAILASLIFSRVPTAGLNSEWLPHAWAGGSAGTMMLNSLSAFTVTISADHAHNIISYSATALIILTSLHACAVTRDEIVSFFTNIWFIVATIAAYISFAAQSVYYWVRHFADPTLVPQTVPAIKKPKKAPTIKKVEKRTAEKQEDSKRVPFIEDPPAPIRDDMPETLKAALPSIAINKKAAPQKANVITKDHDDWEFPPIDLLQAPPKEDTSSHMSEAELRANADMLQNVLQDFNVNGEIVAIHPGPVVTLYELEPAPGTKTSRVIGLSDDIARSMSAVSVRCAVVPGRNVIGIEMPNDRRQTVYLRDVMETPQVQKTKAKLPLILGKDIGGEPVVADLAKMPHLMVAGTTGSGKSVAVNTMIMSLIYSLTPEQCRFIMIDPKMLELSVYDDIPHLLSPVVTEPGQAVVSLKWAVQEMENRYRSMAKLSVRNIEGYNARLREAKKKGETIMRTVQTGFDLETGNPVFEEQPMDMTELPYIVVIVDEFADLMLVAGKDVENAVQRLAQMARAAGIHLIMATQRPSVDVITGVIKANFPTRISFHVTSKIDSRTILGEGGAEQLLGMGDMLYVPGGGQLQRVHGPFVADEEVESVVNHLKSQAAPDYIDDVTSADSFGDNPMMEALFGGGEGGGEKVDELYDQAVAIVARERKASTSFIQRHLQIGYNRAARIIEEMEKQGVVSPATATGKREVLVSDHSSGEF
jgi:S-DNA-T family DNA segregation ATPase FtsK/SpoIIIE